MNSTTIITINIKSRKRTKCLKATFNKENNKKKDLFPRKFQLKMKLGMNKKCNHQTILCANRTMNTVLVENNIKKVLRDTTKKILRKTTICRSIKSTFKESERHTCPKNISKGDNKNNNKKSNSLNKVNNILIWRLINPWKKKNIRIHNSCKK